MKCMMHACNRVYNSLHITIYSHMYIQTHVDNNTKDYVSSYICQNDHNSTTNIYYGTIFIECNYLVHMII